jgi:ABC-type sugar transport system ATPase subunit
MAVINEGVIEQVGTPIEIYEKPETLFVAEFIGTPQMNFIKGKLESNKFISESFNCNTNKNLSDQEIIFATRPENLKVNKDGNIKIKIDLIEKLGADSIIYGFDKANNYICYRENGNTNIKINDEITLEIEKDQYHLFDTTSKKRLN